MLNYTTKVSLFFSVDNLHWSLKVLIYSYTNPYQDPQLSLLCLASPLFLKVGGCPRQIVIRLSVTP